MEAPDPCQTILTAAEVAQRLKVSKNGVHILARAGRLPSLKVGHCRRFVLEDVIAYCRDRAGTTGPASATQSA